MDAGFFPGSGFQTPGDATTGAVRGRLEFGDRRDTLKFTARFDKNSTGLTKLKARTTRTKLAVHIGLDKIRGDEFCAMPIVAEERDLLEREKVAGAQGVRSSLQRDLPSARSSTRSN